MTRNLVMVFTGIFVTTAALDIWTTWVAVIQMGYQATNPYSDTGSIQGLAIREITILVIGMALVILSAHLGSTTLQTPRNASFADFKKRCFTTGNVAVIPLIVIPFVVVILRIVPIFSNTWIIITGWSLFGDEEFSYLSWKQFVYTTLGLALVMPIVYLVFRVCRASSP